MYDRLETLGDVVAALGLQPSEQMKAAAQQPRE